jgi:phage shock protein E
MDWVVILVIAVAAVGLLLFKRLSFVSEDTAGRLLQQGALVIDVRSTTEFASGHLPGAINIELGNLTDEIGRRVSNKDQPLLLHCLSGGRSGVAQHQLKRMGYTNVHNLGSYGRAERIVRAQQR